MAGSGCPAISNVGKMKTLEELAVAVEADMGCSIGVSRAIDFAHRLVAALDAQAEPVAEVLWYDPALYDGKEKARKIIDASIEFMESAPLGAKLYLHASALDERASCIAACKAVEILNQLWAPREYVNGQKRGIDDCISAIEDLK